MQGQEAKLKQKIKDFLHGQKVASLTRPTPLTKGFYWMPVTGGYGAPFLDFVGCYNGRFFAIETKAPGKKPTARQRVNIELVTAGGGRVWVGDDYEQFVGWWNTRVA
jgi:hypothetical protein